MNEENFSDSSFVNYLIDNVNQALIDTETDVADYLKEIKEKLMKNYIKELKKTKKKQSALNLFKNLAKMLKKSSIKESVKDPENSTKNFDSQKSNNNSEPMVRNDTMDTTTAMMRDNSFNKVVGSFDPKMSLFKPKSKTRIF